MNTVKWSALGVVFAILAVILYTMIDSSWAMGTGSSILLTIGFFIVATAAIVCGFNAVDNSNTMHHEH
jgi:hypothetical protein